LALASSPTIASLLSKRIAPVVGTYNPRTSPATVDLKRDRIDFWTGNGAQLSDRVGKLLAAAPAAQTEAVSAA
jgi:small subunit ribosomal protein S16